MAGALARVSNAVSALRGKQSPVEDDAKSHIFTTSLWTPGTQSEPDQSVLDGVLQTHPITYACVNVISQDATQPPMYLARVDKKGAEIDRVTNHRAYEVWNEYVNPLDTPTTFKQQMWEDLLREGNFFCYVEWQTDPGSLIWIDPKEIEAIPDPKLIVGGYRRMLPGGGSRLYRPDQIFHVKTRNLLSRYRGLGPLTRLRDPIAIDQQMTKWRWQFFYNGMPVQMVFRTKKSLAVPGQMERTIQKLEERLVGRNNEGRQFAVLDADEWEVTVIPRPKNDETSYIEGRKLEMQIIAMVFGVPPNKVGNWAETSGLSSNAPEQERLYWEDTIMGWHGLLLDHLNYKFMRMHFPKERDLVWKYDYSAIKALNSGISETSQMMVAQVAANIRTRNEAREQLGLKPHENPLADDLQIQEAIDPNAVDDGDEDEGEGKPAGGSSADDGKRRRGGRGVRPAVAPAVASSSPRGQIVPIAAHESKAAFDDELFMSDDEERRLARLVQAELRRMTRLAGQRQLQLAGLVGAFNIESPQALDFVRRQVIELAGRVPKSVNTLVRRAVGQGLQAGVPIESREMRELLQQAFKTAREPWRLHRIARTEVHTAQEGGAWLAAEQAGLEMKRWITARDDRVRGLDPEDEADHTALEAQGAIPMDAAFNDPRSGAALRFPGDREGAQSGADTINCRCTWVADFDHLDDDGAREERTARLGGMGLKIMREDDLVFETSNLDAVWEVKALQRASFERSLVRILAMYMRGAERRFLARFDEFTAIERARVTGGVFVGH